MKKYFQEWAYVFAAVFMFAGTISLHGCGMAENTDIEEMSVDLEVEQETPKAQADAATDQADETEADRHKGYAKQIMEKLLSDAVEKNLSVVELKSTDDGYRLYQSVGFVDDVPKYHLMKWYRR